jgi:hypothetical protein
LFEQLLTLKFVVNDSMIALKIFLVLSFIADFTFFQLRFVFFYIKWLRILLLKNACGVYGLLRSSSAEDSILLQPVPSHAVRDRQRRSSRVTKYA